MTVYDSSTNDESSLYNVPPILKCTHCDNDAYTSKLNSRGIIIGYCHPCFEIHYWVSTLWEIY